MGERLGVEVPNGETRARLQRLEQRDGTHQVKQWIDEGMKVETMGIPPDMEAFRERQVERSDEIPYDIERRNKHSEQRSENAVQRMGPAGETGVPESVRDVISSSGQSLDASIQRAMEDRMGDSLGDVRIHTGPQAASACDEINARAFTVGNHVAFNSGEYDPESAEGQHVLAHELAHVRQQTGGAVSMLPQEDVELEIDPDPALEREAEETAQRVMEGGELGIQRLADTEVHLQRIPQEQMFSALAVFELENEDGEVGDFQQEQNARRAGKMREWISEFNDETNEIEKLRNEHAMQDLLEAEIGDTEAEMTDDGRMNGPKAVTNEYFDHQRAKEVLQKDLPSKSELQQQKTQIENDLSDKLEQIALTDEQRDKLDVGVENGLLGKIGEKTAFGILKKIDRTFSVFEGAYRVVKQNWGTIDGDIVERTMKLREELMTQAVEDIEVGSGLEGKAKSRGE